MLSFRAIAFCAGDGRGSRRQNNREVATSQPSRAIAACLRAWLCFDMPGRFKNEEHADTAVSLFGEDRPSLTFNI